MVIKMNKEIINKLNENNNFHLSLKVIQASENSFLYKLKEKLKDKNIVIINSNIDIYDQLYNAYINKVDFVLVDSSINYLLPLVNIISNDYIEIIKPHIRSSI